MADISDNIGTEDLRSIVFLLHSSMSRERLDGMQVCERFVLFCIHKLKKSEESIKMTVLCHHHRVSWI